MTVAVLMQFILTMNNAVPNKANYSRHKPSDITTRQEASSFSQYQTPCESPISLPRIESHIEKSRSAYIANAEERVKLTERMLASDPKAHMKLDGGYGDYSMGIFRVKDRKRWLHDAPTLFTNEFRGKIIACFPNNTMDDRLLQEIINRPRSLQKDIAEEPIIAEPNKKDESSLTHRVNKLAEVQDNMNGYLTLKQYP